MFIASDIPAILSHTRDVVILEDGEVAVVTSGGVVLSTLDGQPVQREPVRILWDPIMAEKGGYRHFMLKEIYEQPRAITRSEEHTSELQSRLHLVCRLLLEKKKKNKNSTKHRTVRRDS